MKTKMTFPQYIKIFTIFLKLGCFTFGGGFSLLAQIQDEFVDRQGLLTEEELLDIAALSRSIPGVMIANTTVLFGYHIGGLLCAVIAVIGICLPSVVIITAITYLYQSFHDNLYVARILSGIRCAVIPIIASAAWKLKKAAMESFWSYAIFAIALCLCLFTNLSLIVIIIVSGILGIATSYLPKKGGYQ